MKKLISFALAIVMMLAVCVPAFATDITKDTAQTANADVVTKTTDEEGNSAEKYTVTIPAETIIPWGNPAPVEAPYFVTSQLLLGASLKVSVAANNSGKMTAAGTDKTLTFALENGAEQTFGDICDNQAPATQPTVSIADFSAAPIAAYTGTMTYTVAYVAPATPVAP